MIRELCRYLCGPGGLEGPSDVVWVVLEHTPVHPRYRFLIKHGGHIGSLGANDSPIGAVTTLESRAPPGWTIPL